MNKWIHKGYYALFALLPWSLECTFGSWKMHLPSEPLIALLGLGLVWTVLKEPERLRSALAGNQFLWASAAWIVWMAVCAGCSSMPVVSWKYWIVETGHWWVFAVGLSLFPAFWQRAFLLFVVSMAGVVVYTLVHHSLYHFRPDQSMLAPMPFFPDHTMYGAMIAMVIFKPAKLFRQYRCSPAFDLLLLTGLLFSFSEGAWGSLIGAGVVGLLFYFRKKWRLFLWVVLLFCLTAIFFRTTIIEKTTDIVSENVSLRERLNRYACAFRMAHDRPWTGFGPVTYQYQYLPYQRPEEMTRISVKEPVRERSPHTYGRGGGAHSEYMQALSEAGWPGLILFVVMAAAAFRGGTGQYFRSKNREYQIMVLLLMLALLTFFLHGLLNNLLHDGRIAALVWGMMAVGGRGKELQ